jgi:hypothetical protein
MNLEKRVEPAAAAAQSTPCAAAAAAPGLCALQLPSIRARPPDAPYRAVLALRRRCESPHAAGFPVLRGARGGRGLC